MVDTLGLIWVVWVHAAGIQDFQSGKLLILMLLAQVQIITPRLQIIWADGIYTSMVDWVKRLGLAFRLEVVKRSDKLKEFVPLPKRWIVERTFAWLGRYRRLSKDYEYETRSSEAMIRVASIHLMVRRLVT